MTYDVKIFEGAEEHETIRDLTESQLLGIVSVLERHGIKYLIKDDKGTYFGNIIKDI